MSKVSTLVLGVVSGAAMFGAIQFASGNDLQGAFANQGTLTNQDKVASNSVVPSNVNRAAKSDRASLNTASIEQSKTLSFRVHGVNDTSILVRLAGTARPTSTEVMANEVKISRATPVAAPIFAKSQKSAVACEPPVSVLTDVAKLLQPGRCVT